MNEFFKILLNFVPQAVPHSPHSNPSPAKKKNPIYNIYYLHMQYIIYMPVYILLYLSL